MARDREFTDFRTEFRRAVRLHPDFNKFRKKYGFPERVSYWTKASIMLAMDEMNIDPQGVMLFDAESAVIVALDRGSHV